MKNVMDLKFYRIFESRMINLSLESIFLSLELILTRGNLGSMRAFLCLAI
jgi:hypothetical protein